MRRDHTFALSEKENNLLIFIFFFSALACISFPKMQPGVHYIQSSPCFTQEQLPWAFSSTMQKPYGVQGAGDKPNLSLSARPGAECSFRKPYCKKDPAGNRCRLSSKQLFWQPKKKGAVCNDESWNKQTLLEEKQRQFSPGMIPWGAQVAVSWGSTRHWQASKGTRVHHPHPTQAGGHTAHPGTYMEKENKTNRTWIHSSHKPSGSVFSLRCTCFSGQQKISWHLARKGDSFFFNSADWMESCRNIMYSCVPGGASSITVVTT